MQFPYTPKTEISHKLGGKIVSVHGIKHQECKPRDGRSLDAWWFECDVLWADTGTVSRSPVEPFKLCAGDGAANPDLTALSEAMNDYLLKHGEWCDSGKHQGWYAHRKAKATA